MKPNKGKPGVRAQMHLTANTRGDLNPVPGDGWAWTRNITSRPPGSVMMVTEPADAKPYNGRQAARGGDATDHPLSSATTARRVTPQSREVEGVCVHVALHFQVGGSECDKGLTHTTPSLILHIFF